MQSAVLEARIAQIRVRIAERDGKPGYKRNVMALRTELTRLQQQADLKTFAAAERGSLTPGGEAP